MTDRQSRILFRIALLSWVLLVFLACGCTSRIVYLPEDQKVIILQPGQTLIVKKPVAVLATGTFYRLYEAARIGLEIEEKKPDD